MATTKKTAHSTTGKAVKTTKQAAKKPTKTVAKKAAPVKKTATAKKPAPAAKAAKTAQVTKKAPAAKKAPAKKAPVAKAKNQRSVAKPAAKKTVPAKKVTPAKNAAVSAKKTKPAVASKSAPSKPSTTKTVVKSKPSVQPKADVKKVSPKAPKPETKLKKKSNKESIPVAIKKPVKKKVAPLKEVKVPKTSVKTSKLYEPNYQPLEERIATDSANELMIRYSDAELEEFKVLINKKLADASREVAYLQGIITRKDDMGGDVDGRYMTMEDGTVSMEREQMSQMVSRQISFIDNLKKALIRIENKTYGVCRVTGKLIDKARLRAVPHATLSLEAKLGIVKPKEQN